MRKVRKILGAIVRSVIVLALVLASTGLTAQAAPADSLDSQINQVIERANSQSGVSTRQEGDSPVSTGGRSSNLSSDSGTSASMTRLCSDTPTSSITTTSRSASISIISIISTRPSRSLSTSHATVSFAVSRMSTMHGDPTAQSPESTLSLPTSEHPHISSRLSDRTV